MVGIKRREFITLIGGAASMWPLAARAQQPVIPVIGVLYGVSADEWADRMAAFRQGVGETGFVEGRNVTIEYRWAGGQFDRMGWMAADLIERRVAVILMGGNSAAVRSMLESTRNTPIVFTTGTDPVAAGLVVSLSRPGRNATGITVLGSELGPKRFELLHEAVPSAKKIAVLVNPNNRASSEVDIRDAKAVTPGLGLEMVVVNGGTQDEIEKVFSTLVQQGVGAIYISSDALLNSWRAQIAALALRHKFPTISNEQDAVRAGQLISYGTNDNEMYHQAGVYVGRILKGEKPGDLPVVQPTKFDLVINLKTAKVLGLTIPESFLLRATEIIE
jgi:putative ABC transport system substrate-binding protein